MRSCHAAAAIVALAALLGTRGAGAQERRLKVGAGVGLMSLKVSPFEGGAIGVEGALTYGLTDQFNLLVEATASPHDLAAPAPDPCPDPPAPCEPRRYKYPITVLTGTAGLAYTLDVARVQPYAGLLIGGLRVGAGETRAESLRATKALLSRFDVVLAAGVDVQITARWAAGLAARFHEAPPGGSVSMTAFTLRAQYTWEKLPF